MTGTCFSGRIRIDEQVEIPTLCESRRVKSIQRFREPIRAAEQGDRCGICVTQFDAKCLERGLVSTPGLLQSCYAAIADVHRVAYFKQAISSKAKFHITSGRSVLCTLVLEKPRFSS